MPRALSAATAARLAPTGAPLLPNAQSFETSGTFSVPSNVSLVYVSGCGGGGSGGVSAISNQCSGGGGAGASCFRRPVAVTAGATVTVTIGAGGTATTTPDNTTFVNGNPGGTTSFGSAVSLLGGPAGFGAAATASLGGDAAAATPFFHPGLSDSGAARFSALAQSLSYVVVAGQGGQGGNNATTPYNGRGGASLFSSCVADSSNVNTGIPSAATPAGYGAGGGGKNGSDVVTTGNAGRAGLILVEW